MPTSPAAKPVRPAPGCAIFVGLTSSTTGASSGATGASSGATGASSGAAGGSSGATGGSSGTTGASSGTTGSSSGTTGSSGTSSSGGAVIQACNADADCSSYDGTLGGLCNTTAHVCMQKCAEVSDCPAADNTCSPYTPPGGTTVSGTVCSAGVGWTAPEVINTLDGLCEMACSSTAGCSGYSAQFPP